MPYLQSLVKNEDKITLSPSPNNGVSVFSSPANGNLDMGGNNIVNAGTIAIGKPTDDQATIYFTNTTGTYPLEGDGDKLYYDGNLLAKANDIQDIAAWAEYAASANVDMNNNIIEFVNSVGYNVAGSPGDIGTMYVYNDTVNSVNPTIGIALNGGGIEPVLKNWSYYQAFNNVDMNNHEITNVGFQTTPATGEASLTLTGGTIKFPSGDTVESVGGVLTVSPNGGIGTFYNPIPVASGWASYPAIDAVDLSGNQLVHASLIGIKTVGGEGQLTTTGAGAILLFNGDPISTGTGGDVAQWSTFPSVNNLILPNPTLPTTPLTIGTRASGTNVNIETNASLIVNADDSIQLNAAFDDLTGDSLFQMTDTTHTMTIDRGNSLLGQATINMTAQNGTGGRINIYAQSSSPVAPAAGGLVDITAYSAIGSVSPLALSRVNVEAATVSVQAGALGALAYVPGSINLLSGLGTGVQILTGTGVINIASGVALTLAGGLGVFLNGASSGVQVAGGNLKITNGNQLSTDQIGSFTGGGSIGFVSPIVAGKIADSASSYGTAGQVATATGSGSNWAWTTPATGVASLNSLTGAVSISSSQLTVGTSGQNVTVNVPASLNIPTIYTAGINALSPATEVLIPSAKVSALRSDTATLPLIKDGALSQGTAGQVATANGTTGWSWATPPPVKQATYYKSAVQNLTSGSTVITFDVTAPWNNVNGYITHTNGTTDFTVVQAGLYQLEFNALIFANNGTWTTTTNKGILINISRLVNTTVINNSALMAPGVNYGQSVNGTFYLLAGDVITLIINNTYTGGTPTAPQVQPVANGFDLNTFFTWTFVST